MKSLKRGKSSGRWMNIATWGKYRLKNTTWGKYRLKNATCGKYRFKNATWGYRLKKTTRIRVEECDPEDGLKNATLSTG